MTNLLVYKKTSQLKDYLENTEFEEFPVKTLSKVDEHLNEIFRLLDRRKP